MRFSCRHPGDRCFTDQWNANYCALVVVLLAIAVSQTNGMLTIALELSSSWRSLFYRQMKF
ncbi:MAG: hypothetical protein WBM32_00075 [Crocosphaera sp.]